MRIWLLFLYLYWFLVVSMTPVFGLSFGVLSPFQWIRDGLAHKIQTAKQVFGLAPRPPTFIVSGSSANIDALGHEPALLPHPAGPVIHPGPPPDAIVLEPVRPGIHPPPPDAIILEPIGPGIQPVPPPDAVVLEPIAIPVDGPFQRSKVQSKKVDIQERRRVNPSPPLEDGFQPMIPPPIQPRRPAATSPGSSSSPNSTIATELHLTNPRDFSLSSNNQTADSISESLTPTSASLIFTPTPSAAPAYSVSVDEETTEIPQNHNNSQFQRRKSILEFEPLWTTTSSDENSEVETLIHTRATSGSTGNLAADDVTMPLTEPPTVGLHSDSTVTAPIDTPITINDYDVTNEVTTTLMDHEETIQKAAPATYTISSPTEPSTTEVLTVESKTNSYSEPQLMQTPIMQPDVSTTVNTTKAERSTKAMKYKAVDISSSYTTTSGRSEASPVPTESTETTEAVTTVPSLKMTTTEEILFRPQFLFASDLAQQLNSDYGSHNPTSLSFIRRREMRFPSQTSYSRVVHQGPRTTRSKRSRPTFFEMFIKNSLLANASSPEKAPEIFAEVFERLMFHALAQDKNYCIARSICLIAAEPEEYGPLGMKLTEFFKETSPSQTDLVRQNYRAAAFVGDATKSKDACFSLYPNCRLDHNTFSKLANSTYDVASRLLTAPFKDDMKSIVPLLYERVLPK